MLLELLRELPEVIQGTRRDEAPVPGAPEAAVGVLQTDAGGIQIRIVVGSGFPYSAPTVWLQEEGVPSAPPLLPSGAICWHDATGEAVDHSRPIAVLRHCLERVRALLDHSLHERPWRGVMAEYETYWNFRAKEHWLLTAPAEGRVQALSEAMGGLAADPRGTYGLLVPTSGGELPLPPDQLDMTWIREHLLSRVGRTQRQEISRIIGQRLGFRRVVFQIPRANGLDIYLGVRFRRWRGRHPLRSRGKGVEVSPVSVGCLDMDYLRERGGADMTLKAKRVAVIGCGSVGGQVALDLVRSGVGHLYLVDPDRMETGNAFRHVLGLRGVVLPKAEALAADIATRFPDVELHPRVATVERLLADGDFPQVDAIIVCIDRPSGAQAVNAKLHCSGDGPPIVHAWLEAYGLACHVLRTQPGTAGCFECLLRHPDTGDLIGNRAALAAADQDFTKDQAGCGGRYVPFGAVHATRTAAIAVEETIKGLRGEKGPVLVTWRGDATPFRDAGFELSDRGRAWPPDRILEVLGHESIAVASCPVCA